MEDTDFFYSSWAGTNKRELYIVDPNIVYVILFLKMMGTG